MKHVESRGSWALALGVVVLAAIAAVAQTGCGPGEPPAAKALQVTDVVTGWLDDGIRGGENKLVPLISYKVKNSGSGPVTYVSFNAVFKVIDDPEELGSALLKGIDGKGLPPGQTAGPFVARSQLGYTSPAPRTQMLQHSQFKDVQVELFSKHQSGGWIKIGQYKIQRQVIAKE